MSVAPAGGATVVWSPWYAVFVRHFSVPATRKIESVARPAASYTVSVSQQPFVKTPSLASTAAHAPERGGRSVRSLVRGRCGEELGRGQFRVQGVFGHQFGVGADRADQA